MTLFDVANAISPVEETPPTTGSNHIAASWSFGSVEPNGVTPDTTGNNPAVLSFSGNVLSVAELEALGLPSAELEALGAPYSSANYTFTPQLVEGKFGGALSFSGDSYVYVPSSSSLTIPGDITIEAWVKVNQFKNVTYNTIVVEFASTYTEYPLTAIRILGLAINGVAPTNSTSPVLGALQGYVTTDTGGFNEIDTTQPLSLNEWYHVVFTRSIQTGMHIYVNGVEQNVTVFAGTQNPAGSIEQATGLYLGHDSITTLENIQILNVTAEPTSTHIWQQWWFWTPVATALAVLAVIAYYVRKNGIKQNTAIFQASPYV
jgi:hypothetical protein